MDEKEEAKKEEQGGTEENSGDGNDGKNSSPIEQARAENERLEKNLKKKEELLTREENLEASKILGGKSSVSQPEKPKEETPEEYVDKIERGEFNETIKETPE